MFIGFVYCVLRIDGDVIILKLGEKIGIIKGDVIFIFIDNELSVYLVIF